MKAQEAAPESPGVWGQHPHGWHLTGGLDHLQLGPAPPSVPGEPSLGLGSLHSCCVWCVHPQPCTPGGSSERQVLHEGPHAPCRGLAWPPPPQQLCPFPSSPPHTAWGFPCCLPSHWAAWGRQCELGEDGGPVSWRRLTVEVPMPEQLHHQEMTLSSVHTC